MRTRSQSRNLDRQQQQAPPAFVEPFNLEEPIENPAPPVFEHSTPGISPCYRIEQDMEKLYLLDKKSQAPTPVKAVEESCVTCGGAHSYRNCTGTLLSNTVTNPKGRPWTGITTRSGVAYQGPTVPTTSSPKVVERETEVTKDTVPPTKYESTKDVQPPVVQDQPHFMY
ncbi:hypothetical protein Tco_0755051 [Tanacetum coccineum]